MNLLKIISVALVIIMLGSCKKDRAGLTEEPGKAKIAIVNLVTPNRPSSTTAASGLLGYYLFMDNVRLFTQSLIPNKTTGYLAAEPGNRSIRIDSTETVVNAIKPSAAVNSTALQAEAGKYYSIFYTGKVQSPEVVVTTDDLSRPPAGKAKIRVINLSPDAGALDIAGAFTTATTLPTVLFPNLTYKTQPVFSQIDAGFYKLEVRRSGVATAIGTFTQSNQVIPSFIPGGSIQANFNMNFESGMVYTLVIRGYATPSLAAVGQLANPLSVGALINVYF